MINIELDTTVDRYSSIGILQTMKENPSDDIQIGVSSLGGDLDEGLKMYYGLIEHKGNSTAVFKGRSASAATIFAMGAKKRKIYQNSFVLIHKVLNNTFLYGYLNSDDIGNLIAELKKEKSELDGYDLALANIYYQKAKKKGKSEKDILNLMSKDTWLNSEQALEWGFVDEIINEDFEYNENTQNALLNLYNLPAFRQETNTKTMNFLDKVKQFFNSSLGLDATTAETKANDFIASFNSDLQAAINEKLATIEDKKTAEIEELKNSISSLQNSIAEIKTAQQIAVTQDTLNNKVAELDTKLNSLGEKIVNTKTPNVDTNQSNYEGLSKWETLMAMKAEGKSSLLV